MAVWINLDLCGVVTIKQIISKVEVCFCFEESEKERERDGEKEVLREGGSPPPGNKSLSLFSGGEGECHDIEFFLRPTEDQK